MLGLVYNFFRQRRIRLRQLTDGGDFFKMTITWYGENCFKIQSGQITILTDPPSPTSDLKQPRFGHAILIKTLSPTPLERPVGETAFTIIGPGEYQMQNLTIRGFHLVSESTEKFIKTVYVIRDGDISLCLLGHIAESKIEPEILEEIMDTDIIVVPAGGKPFLLQEEAAKLVNRLEPGFVIPSCFKIPGLARTSDDVKKFLKSMGGGHQLEKLTVKRKDINPNETKVVVLEPN